MGRGAYTAALPPFSALVERVCRRAAALGCAYEEL